MRVQTRQLHHITLLSVIERLLAEPTLALDELSLGFSKDHFNRFFRDAMGETLHEFSRRIRLERAANELTSGAPIYQVAAGAGYETSESFAKAFRSEFQVSPGAYAASPTRDRLENVARWGDRRTPLSIETVTRFGASLLTMDSLPIAAIPFRGDYSEIPAVWESLGGRISSDLKESRSWVTVFHSDGLMTTDRHKMTARLGYLDDGGVMLPGFEPFTISGGAYVASTVVSGRESHAEAWSSFNKLWVPKSGPRPVDLPAFDLYEEFPDSFADVRASIYLRLE